MSNLRFSREPTQLTKGALPASHLHGLVDALPISAEAADLVRNEIVDHRACNPARLRFVFCPQGRSDCHCL